ncbi:hypothetical protein BpHYR1_012309 [Brachionus plicatilis]|uniref:Uncharacterized protein n=1 Tax=Brachionus plicatilis TaxID=10195 RepID=A0A3M7R847_BRAPC|nr:hypothetical protein BpHYR1_012309 [Brachionus plicatilis]
MFYTPCNTLLILIEEKKFCLANYFSKGLDIERNGIFRVSGVKEYDFEVDLTKKTIKHDLVDPGPQEPTIRLLNFLAVVRNKYINKKKGCFFFAFLTGPVFTGYQLKILQNKNSIKKNFVISFISTIRFFLFQFNILIAKCHHQNSRFDPPVLENNDF